MTALPETVTKVLNEFLEAAKKACGTRLEAAVLFGSAAEGRLRPASDVNLILVLSSFGADDAAAVAPQLRFAESAIKLRVMFPLASEIPDAATAFAQKFSDIAKRRLLLHGADPFVGMTPPREALQRQVDQVLLNLGIRLRERATSGWQHEDLVARTLAAGHSQRLTPTRSTSTLTPAGSWPRCRWIECGPSIWPGASGSKIGEGTGGISMTICTRRLIPCMNC